MSRNVEVATLLEEFADLLDANDVEYKPRAYRRAAENVREHPEPIELLAEEGHESLQRIDGVGEAIAEKIEEYLETGEIEELEDLRTELPVAMGELTAVEGVGPKTVGSLYRALGIETLDDLERAAREERIREVDGFGAKTEENILENLEFARQAGERSLLGEVRPLADAVLARLRSDEAVETCEVAGSIRRWRETIGDVDALAASGDRSAVIETFTDWTRVESVIEAGENKASVRVAGVRIDLRVVAPEEFGASLQYFTGSRDHNIRLRNRAIREGLKVNEYGVFDVSELDDAGGEEAGGEEESEGGSQREGTLLASETEEEVYAALDLDWVPPELREDAGEIDAAASGELPDLVEEGDVRGDLHVHTDWSDGALPIEETIAAAEDFGHEYLCIADHATGPGVVSGMGLSDEELLEQADLVRDAAVDAAIDVFAGVEANVDAGGEISVADDVLAQLDFVVASPHSGLSGDRESSTERLVRAVSHPHVDVLGHPSGRLLNQRAGMELDVREIARAAAEHGTALEVNANPARLDLNGTAVRAAIEEGATIVINTDAHSPGEFANVRYGVHTARRGWAEASDVLNAQNVESVESFVNE